MAKKAKKLEGSLQDRLLKATKNKNVSLISNSKYHKPPIIIPCRVPMMAIALSGSIYGGLEPGVITLAGPSKNFKTSYALTLAADYLRKYPDGYVVLFDSEFGSPAKYLKNFDLDLSRIVHIPVDTVESLKYEAINLLKNIEADEHVLLLVDSVGALASEKEIEDATKGDCKVDFTRAKELNSFYRMFIPKVNMLRIPALVINHTYKTIETFAKDKLKGGEGGVYASNTIWIIGKSQDTNGKKGKEKELYGFNFNIKIDKSRCIREGEIFPITARYGEGILKYSGLGELCEEFGYFTDTKIGKKGAWEYVDKKTGNVIAITKEDAQTDDEWWTIILKDIKPQLDKDIQKKYLM